MCMCVCVSMSDDLEELVKMLLAMPFTAKTEEDNFTKLDARRKLGAKKLAFHQGCMRTSSKTRGLLKRTIKSRSQSTGSYSVNFLNFNRVLQNP